MAATIDEELILDWTTAIEALDLISIQEIFDIQPELLWTPLKPLAHLENDFSHFINKLEGFKLLGTSIRPVYALHHILFDYGLEGDEWAPERIELVDFILKHTKGNELNTCLWGEEQNTAMHLAYLINQPDLTQLLMDKGALINIPNKSGHLPIKQVADDNNVIVNDEVTATDAAAPIPTPTVSNKSTSSLQEDSQPEVKLLINKSKSAAAANKERIPVNTSDRFKRLRELAESPGANNNKPISERQNSTRRYFRPGHLEERRRRVLSEEEEAELEKQRLKRQKEVDMLAQRSAVKNNPLFKKFEEQTQGQQQQGKPVISAVSAIRDRKKLLGAADQIRRTSRVINSLKDRSYVSGSVFRQQSDTATGSVSTENNLRVPTLAQLRAGPPTPTSTSRETSPNVSDNEEEEEEPVKSKVDSSKITPSTQKQIPVTPTKENFTASTTVTNDTTIDQKNSDSSVVTIETSLDSLAESKDKTSLDSSAVIKNKSSVDDQKEDIKLSTTSLKSTNDVNGVTTTAKTSENDIESLSIGKLSNVNREVKPSNPSKNQIGSSKVKQIVNVHEHLNEETEIENYSTGKVFSVWKKNEHGDLIEETQERSFTSKGTASEELAIIDKHIDNSTVVNDSSVNKSKPLLPAKSKSRPTSKAINVKKEEAEAEKVGKTVYNVEESASTILKKGTQNTIIEENTSAPNLVGSRSIKDLEVTAEVQHQEQEEQHLMNAPRAISTKEHDHVLQDNKSNHAESTSFESSSPSPSPSIIIADEKNLGINKEEYKEQKEQKTGSVDKELDIITTDASKKTSSTSTTTFNTQPTIENHENAQQINIKEPTSSPSSLSSIIIDTPKDNKLDNYNLRINTFTTTNTIAEESGEDYDDDEDQDSAKTPTLANPQPDQQKQLDTLLLLNQREDFEFQDDTNQIDDRTSYCSDTNETSILRSFNIQQEEQFDQWTNGNNMSATAAAAKKRQSGSQRNYWSTGIQMVDAAAAAKKRESTTSSIAAHSISETGSEQWFDPDDDWTVDSHRQSQLKTNRHSDSSVDSSTFSYKHSDLTDNTRVEDDDDDYSYYKQQVHYDHITSQSQQEHAGYEDDREDQEKLHQQRSIDQANGEDYYSTNGHTIPSRFDGRESIIDVLPPALDNATTNYNNDKDEDDYYSTSLHAIPPKNNVNEAQPRQLHTTTIPSSAIGTAIIDKDNASDEDDYYSTNLHSIPSKSNDKEAQPRQLNTTTIPSSAIGTATIDKDNDSDEDDYYSTNLHSIPSKSNDKEAQPRQLHTTTIPNSVVATATVDGDSDDDQEEYYASTNAISQNHSDKDAQPRQLNTTTISSSAIATATIDQDSDDGEDDYYSTNLHAIPSNQNEKEIQSRQLNTTSNSTVADNNNDVQDDYYSTNLHTIQSKQASEQSTASIQLHQLNTTTISNTATTTASIDYHNDNVEDDYYSTMLHTASSNRTEEKGMSSYYQHNEEHDQGDHEEEGEITVFMNHQFHQQPEQDDHNQSLNSLHSNTNTIEQSSSSQRDFLSVKTEINENDDTHSLYKVPSRTIDIADAGTVQASVPHDPNHPRIEDISHYMNALPALGGKNKDVGGSMFDLDEQQDAIVKRVISTKENSQLENEAAIPNVELNPIRGIPNAHEVNEHFMSNMHATEEGKISMSSLEASQFGKMYIGVSGAHHMLLPLPKEITYVRCVISDGEYEYMSRYEVLGHQILMDYECVIDTKPGMIITVSLHVRPDYHVKPRTGWSRWFTSIRKQKEHLSGYVHPDDGAIGQTRFAVDHMVPGCHKKTYEAHFDCFNSWYARTTRERARREQFGDEEDFLKIVGKLNVEMLYLPVSNPSVQVPRSLRECDLTLKIRQWHDTCWQSGYLTTRCQGNKIWERHYYRLIGSQLIGYTNEENEINRQVWDHYNIADVLRLSAAADKVIITLVEEDTSKVFTDTIHSNESKGFFRLTFSDYYLDCVSDDLDDSEEWVKTLKSMIGRVPLRLPFSD